MKNIKKLIRLFWLALLIMLAMTGIGISGALFSNREKYQNKPMQIEMKDKRASDEEE